MTWTGKLLPLALFVAGPGCGGGDKTSDSSTSGETTAASTTGAPTTGAPTTGGPTTGAPTTGSTGGSDSDAASSSGGTTTTAGTTTSASGTTGTSTDATTTTTATTDISGSSSSSGGDVCSAMGGSCAQPGELCCDGLDCCAGVPVPMGKEFCSDNCPISDRRLKADFVAVDPAQVLERVVALPISSWRYLKDAAVVRHIGPMAQDFHAAFGLWDSDTMIFPLDASGVSMAAIQGLHARLVAAEAENEELRARLDRLERRLDATRD